ncbi:PREDICTED: uncharacterized protein LOC108748519 [Trachymyrmex septentrionalis]|uniref:uncharacterized protein LOC108748519 n=1 Tax=Trachymyrmex septentrionalis TaxID=34720 RepID=UPI00084F2239|nr:PREDICTED: uncharacterized protein LOC108748519 [Trachymyrmex septentrionalis]
MFQSMIHNNETLPDVQKMQYLISILKDEARNVIGPPEVTGENYMKAWEMLKERFNDSSSIIQKHFRALFEMPVVQKENHLVIRRLLDDVLKHLRALERPIKHWDDLIVHMITSRLDHKTRRDWEVTIKKNEIPTLKHLIEFLAQHNKALEASARATHVGAASAGHEKGSHSKSTLVLNLTIARHKCVYCNKEDHAIYRCDEYLRLEVDRKIKEAKARNLLELSTKYIKPDNARWDRAVNVPTDNTLLHSKQPSTKRQEAAQEGSITDQEKVVATTVSSSNSVKQSK